MIEGDQAPIQCAVYVLGNLLMVALAVYKCNNMGLLPTYASDWLSFVEPAQVTSMSIIKQFFCGCVLFTVLFAF